MLYNKCIHISEKSKRIYLNVCKKIKKGSWMFFVFITQKFYTNINAVFIKISKCNKNNILLLECKYIKHLMVYEQQNIFYLHIHAQ